MFIFFFTETTLSILTKRKDVAAEASIKEVINTIKMKKNEFKSELRKETERKIGKDNKNREQNVKKLLKNEKYPVKLKK